jgi:hypothetical protein
MRAAYGNCVRDADKRTWDVWGKEFTNVLTSGKIDLLAARYAHIYTRHIYVQSSPKNEIFAIFSKIVVVNFLKFSPK